MTGYEPMSASDLPLACSVLHHFDADSLQVITPLDATAVRALLASAIVAPLAPGADRYQLISHVRAILLHRLRREQPRDERVLHRKAFDYYLQRLAANPQQPDPFVEAAALHHLRALRDLNLDYMQWAEVGTLIEALRKLGPLQPQHADELTLYIATNAMRAHLAAYILMVQFYQNLADGQPVVAALHRAQLTLQTLKRDEVASMIQRLFHADIQAMLRSLDEYDPVPFARPRYWAPFMVIGKPAV